MSDIKSKTQGLESNLQARNIQDFVRETKNIYKTLSIIAKRSNQISVDLKKELHSKLEEFATNSDAIEEIHENKEQIEISKFYERLPNPALIATDEYFNGKIESREREEEENNEELV